MKTLLLSFWLLTLVSPAIQPVEEKVVKFDKAQVSGLREEQRNKVEGLGVKSCGKYFLLINEKEIAYMVKSGKTFSLRMGNFASMSVEIDNKLKSPLVRMSTGTAVNQTASPLLRLSQKEYDNAKDCLPKLK